MTIASSTNKINHAPDGVQLIFPYDFRVDNATDMVVYLDSVVVPSGWTIDNLGNPVGGNVTFTVAPDGDVLTLLREVPLTQGIDYTPYDAFPAETHEEGLDKLTMALQQQSEVIGRGITAPVSDAGTTDFTLPVYEAGKGIVWHPTEQRMTNSDGEVNGIVTAAAASAAAASVSETNAIASENKAYQWAEEGEDVEVDPGEYSAKHYSLKAATFNPANYATKSYVDDQRGLATAWVSFDGTGTPSIKDSYNVTSVVKGSSGRYTITFSTPMDNANYVCVCEASDGLNLTQSENHTVDDVYCSFAIWTGGSGASASYSDVANAQIVVFGGKD